MHGSAVHACAKPIDDDAPNPICVPCIFPPNASPQLETGVSEPALLKIIAAIAVANLVLGLLPRSPTYSASNQQRMAERERTASRELQQERGLLWPLSLRNGGLNKRNELVVGRTAMVLFVVVCRVGAGVGGWVCG